MTLRRLQNGIVELENGQGIRAQFGPQPDLAFSAATGLLAAAAQRWNSQNPLQLLGQVSDATSQLPNLGGSGAYQVYEQNLVDERGPNVVHGLFYLHVRHAGQGMTVDAFANGPAAGADWKSLGTFVDQILPNLRVQPRQ
jgi:hypothetical protein